MEYSDITALRYRLQMCPEPAEGPVLLHAWQRRLCPRHVPAHRRSKRSAGACPPLLCPVLPLSSLSQTNVLVYEKLSHNSALPRAMYISSPIPGREHEDALGNLLAGLDACHFLLLGFLGRRNEYKLSN